MEQKEIRFIDSRYNELFRIASEVGANTRRKINELR